MIATLNIVSLNCNGLGDRNKRRRLFRHLTRRNVDVILLQETHSTPDSSKLYKAEWKRLKRNHHSEWNSGTSRSCGVAVLLSNKNDTQIINTCRDPHGRVLNLQIRIDTEVYQFSSVYAPSIPGSRPLFNEELDNYFFPDGETIMGGDFNMVEDVNLDRVGGTIIMSTHQKGKTELVQLKQQQNLVDIWRDTYPTQREYTWSSPDNLIHSRLDRFYLSQTLQPSFLEQTHLFNSFSDHKTLTLRIQLKDEQKRGEGYWKLNAAFLQDKEYINLIEAFLREWIAKLPDYVSIQLWWIQCKNWIKKITIDYATQQKQLRKRKISVLRKFLKAENNKTNPDKDYIVDTEEKISTMESIRHAGTVIRSREQMLIDGEKPTRYFYSLERINKSKSTLNKLTIKSTSTSNTCNLNDNNNNNSNNNTYTEITDENEILQEIHKYFKNIFTAQNLNTNLQDELLSKIDRKLPANMKSKMDSKITKKELTFAKDQFHNNKSPGIDGLPIEFYVTFWHLLSDVFFRLANDIYSHGLEPGAQQRISLIALIHKKFEKENLDNWRPISLLCVDFKLIAKVLSLRLKAALPHILGEEQTCGVLGRTIFENLYTIRDVIGYTRDHELPGYILSLDFQKAFDKVDHNFLAKTLKAFGFGPIYTSYILSSLSNCVARVCNNGRFTADIPLERGIKQGENESSQIFDIIAEVLAIQIRKNKGIKGLHVPGRHEELKLSLYADDNNCILTSTHSIVNLFKELQRFEEASGCNINHKKTLGLTLGDAPVPDHLPYPIFWNPPTGVKILGITFHHDPLKTVNATWNSIIEKIQNRAATLTPRKLSFKGKGIIINSLLLSKAWHAATVIPALKKHVIAIEKIIFNYLFDNKLPHKPAQDVLKLRLEHGGIGLKDFDLQQTSLRLNRLRLTLDQTNNAPWTLLTRLYTAADICRHNNDWPFLNSPTVPKINFQDPDNSSLRLRLQPYHLELQEFLRVHKRSFLKLKNPSTSSIYNILLKHKQPHIWITSQTYWNAETERFLPWQKIWKTTYQSLDKSHHLDVYYKFLHNAHATGGNLAQSKKRNYETRCPTCHRFETTLHTFAACIFTRKLWNRYFYFYSDLLGTQDLSYGDILFSIHLPTDRHKRLLVLTMTNIIMSEIWRARCAHKKDGVPTNVDASTLTINSRIKTIHYAYQKQTANFATKLCLPSPICTLINNSLVFDLPTSDTFNIFGDESDLTSDYFTDPTTDTTTTSELSSF